MSQQNTNQERSRKYGGSSSFTDTGTPSRAPCQDEQGDDRVGSRAAALHRSKGDDRASVTGRRAEDEHAIPDRAAPIDDAATSDESEALNQEEAWASPAPTEGCVEYRNREYAGHWRGCSTAVRGHVVSSQPMTEATV